MGQAVSEGYASIAAAALSPLRAARWANTPVLFCSQWMQAHSQECREVSTELAMAFLPLLAFNRVL